MATTDNYTEIKKWLDPNPRSTFTAEGYKKDGVTDDEKFRRLCPHVLGYKKGGSTSQDDERVLCWQLAGPGTNPQWRCYKVKYLVGIKVDTVTPWQMGTDYSKHQICSKKEDVWVPYP
jgi:hypothetical protein